MAKIIYCPRFCGLYLAILKMKLATSDLIMPPAILYFTIARGKEDKIKYGLCPLLHPHTGAPQPTNHITPLSCNSYLKRGGLNLNFFLDSF